jgi:mgtE-like transporter
VESAAAMMHVLFGIFAFIVAYGTGLGGDPIPLVLVALGSNLVSFPFISLLSLITATQTFKRGLDPDNFVIPLVTSVSDLYATLGLVAVLMVLAI